jgi:hypothetical protein
MASLGSSPGRRVKQVSLTPFMVRVAPRPLIQNSMPALA